MKGINYYAPAAFGAWAKNGYLFENGIFICEFKYYNEPYYICRKYDFKNPPETTTWGKNVIDHFSNSLTPGALNDYQTFQKEENIEKDFEEIRNSILSRNVKFWNEKHHSSEKLI